MDPGYGSTSKMLGQAALCLAEGGAKVGGGFFTPAAAMGDALIERLDSRKAQSRERAAELVAGTKLGEVSARKDLIDGGHEATLGSDDPMITLARQVEAEYRRIRSKSEQIEERERQAYAQISGETAKIATQASNALGTMNERFRARADALTAVRGEA